MPVTFILHLEKQVQEVLAFFRAVQTLDPAEAVSIGREVFAFLLD